MLCYIMTNFKELVVFIALNVSALQQVLSVSTLTGTHCVTMVMDNDYSKQLTIIAE